MIRYSLAMEIAQNDGKIKVINLSRNFGHHKALMAGALNGAGARTFSSLTLDLEELSGMLAPILGPALRKRQRS